MNRILADENIPRASILELRKADLDVSSVAEIRTGMSDLQVLEIARSEERLLWTFDRDFGELIYRRGEEAPPAVVYMRFVPQTPEEPGIALRKLLDHAEIELAGKLTVVDRDQVRQRPLP